MSLPKYQPAYGLRALSIVIIGLIALIASMVLLSLEARGDPQSDPYIEETDITVPAVPNEGDIVTINITLHNKGLDAPVYVHVRLTGPQVDSLLTTETLTLKENITSYINLTWDSSKKKSVEYTVKVEIENRTEDMNITNNTAEKKFTVNARPIVDTFDTTSTDVLRVSSVTLSIDPYDIETADDQLVMEIQASPTSQEKWNASFFSASFWDVDVWKTNFTPSATATLGYYDFRARFTDPNDGVGDWFYSNEWIYVLNNVPQINGTIPDAAAIEDDPLTLDLTPYEIDVEDNATIITWYVHSYNPELIRSITGENSTDDNITFTPFANFTGTTRIIVVLIDKEGAQASQELFLTWSPVNDAPIVDNITFSANHIYRTETLSIIINATDDNSTEANLAVKLQYLEPGEVNWTDYAGGIIYNYIDGAWLVKITPDIGAVLGNYSLRLNITDDNLTNPSTSHYYYYNNSIDVRNNPPVILDITPAISWVIRNNTLVFTVNGTDIEDPESAFNITVESKYKKYAFNPYPGAWYDTINASWSFNFTPSITTGIGNWTFRARFIDRDGGMSDWNETTIVVINNLPVAINLSLSLTVIEVDHTIHIFANGTDIEDIESKLTPVVEYRVEDGSGIWQSVYVGSATYTGDVWTINFNIPENATLGDYSIRVHFVDLDGNVSDYVTLNNALKVVNNPPVVLNMGISRSTLPRTNAAILFGNADCDLDEEDKLTAEFQYYHLAAWRNDFLDTPVYHFDRWEVNFTPDKLDSTLGNYSFRVRFKLRESQWSDWFHFRNGTTVINSIPVIQNLRFASIAVNRSDSLTVMVYVRDAEDPASTLNLTLMYSLAGGPWQTADLSVPVWVTDHFEIIFTPPTTTTIGNYSFRVNSSDSEGGSSIWYTNATKIWVMNNLPFVVNGPIPVQSIKEENILNVRLTNYEGDIEDGNLTLDWYVMDYNDSIIRVIENDPNYDLYKFHPVTNFTGYTNVTMKLIDSDSGYILVNVTLYWTSVNDAPIVDLSWTDNTTVLRGQIFTLYINATDDDDLDKELMPQLHYSLNAQTWYPTTVIWEIVGGTDNGTIAVQYIVPLTLTPGDYFLRVRVKDTSGDARTEFSEWYRLAGTVEFANNDPVILGFTFNSTNVYRTQGVPITLNASDIEDAEENLTIEISYSYDYDEDTKIGTWNIGFFGPSEYNETEGNITADFIPGKICQLGKVFFRFRAVDMNGGKSTNWTDVMNITVLNNDPVNLTLPLPFSIDEDNVLSVNLTDYGLDAEDDPSDLRWYVDACDANVILDISGNGTTVLDFTPVENFTGITTILLNLTDLDGNFTTLSVQLKWNNIYEAPYISGYIFSSGFVYRNSTMNIQIDVNDDDDPIMILTGYLQYKPPNGDWTAVDLIFQDGNWSYDFTPALDWVTGMYTFRARFNDTDELFCPWIWTNISVKSKPMVDSFDAPAEAYRTKTVILYVNGSDSEEDKEWELTPHFQYSRSNVTFHTNYFDAPYHNGDSWQVNFTPGASLALDEYIVRMRFNDTDGAYSNWKYITIQIRNNPPEILGVISGNALEDNDIILDLILNSNDSEDPDAQLQWTAEWQTGIKSLAGNGTTQLTFTPNQDFTGEVPVTLTVTDLDGSSSSAVATLNWTPVNDAPRLSNLELASDTVDLHGEYLFHTGTDLSAKLHGMSDPENDGITVYYSWAVNGLYVIENSTVDDVFSSTNFVRGDSVTLRVIVSDGIDMNSYFNVTIIGNAPPSISGVDIRIYHLGLEVDQANVTCVLEAMAINYNDLDGDPADLANFTYEWYNSGILVVSGYNITSILANQFEKGDEVWCRVLPYDGYSNGSGVRSNTAHIYNTPPSLGIVPTTYTGGEPFGPNEHSMLQLDISEFFDPDGDIQDGGTFLYEWFVNDLGTGITEQTLSSADFQKGDEVYCRVTPYDGEEYGDPVDSTTIPIQNTPPSLKAAAIEYTGTRPDKNSILTVNISQYVDLDGDPADTDNFIYEWFRNDVFVANGPSLDLDAYDRGDIIFCNVTPYDGESPGAKVMTFNVTIDNTPPIITSADIQILFQGLPVGEANHSCVLQAVGGGYSDADGDPAGAFQYTWYVNDNFAKTGETLDGNYFVKDDSIFCIIRSYDGMDYGEPMLTGIVDIINTAPVITGVTVSTFGEPTRTTTVNAQPLGYFDEDDDTQGSHDYIWYKNGEIIPGAPHAISIRNTEENFYFTKGDVISVVVRPFDGTDYGEDVPSTNAITIINTPPVLEMATLEYTEPVNKTSVLTVETEGFYYDPDGDTTINFYYEWYVKGKLVETQYNKNTISGIFVSGNRVFCKVIPNDGEDNGTAYSTRGVIIEDSPPELYGEAVLTSDTLPITKGSTIQVDTAGLDPVDIDGDKLSYVYYWYVNDEFTGAPAGNSLYSTYFNKDDEVYCRIHVFDGVLESSSYINTPVKKIGNSDPVAVITSPKPFSEVDVTDLVHFDASGSYDPDNADVLSYIWFVDGEQKGENITEDISMEPGNHTISLGVSDGTSHDNAEVTIHIRAADLLITEERIIVSGPLYTGEIISFIVDVGNLGDGDARNFTVKFYMDNNLIGSQEITLESNNNETKSISWRATIGLHTIQVKLDEENIIEETDHGNNVAEYSFEVTVKPKSEDLFLDIEDQYWYLIGGMLFAALVLLILDFTVRNKGIGLLSEESPSSKKEMKKEEKQRKKEEKERIKEEKLREKEEKLREKEEKKKGKEGPDA